MAHKIDDDFIDFEQNVQEIMNILKGDEPQREVIASKIKPVSFDGIDVNTVQLTVRESRTLINKRAEERQANATMDQQSFMKQVEEDANMRHKTRAERQYQAEQLRSKGNAAFRNKKYEKAILCYDKAVERIKDSAITYNNRALCYIKLGNYKRALEDCDYVLNKLQECNLRAWLYRATAYKRLQDAGNFKASVDNARKHNPEQLAYIDKFIDNMDVNI